MKRQFQAFSYKVENKSDDTLDVYIDGIIVDAETEEIYKKWYGIDSSVSYKSFRNQILQANPKVLNVHVNSGGGLVTDAMAMHDFLVEQQNNGVEVNTIGRGMVASAATYIVMAGGKNSSLSENCWFMIHNVSGGVWGDVNIVENYAATMRKFNDNVVGFYAKVTGLEEKDVQDMMDAETWMNATEAKKKGFVKNIADKSDYSNAIQPEHWPYSNTAVLNAYNSGVKKPSEAKPEAEQNNFFTTLQNGFMKLFDLLTGSIKNGKEDPQFAKIENRDAILDMVNKVLGPVIKNIDDALAAAAKNDNGGGGAKPEETTTTEKTEEEKKKEAEAADKKKKDDEADEKKKKEDEEAAGETDDELENLKKKVANQEAEMTKLRNDLAGKITKPANANGGKASAASKVKVQYEED